MVISSATCSCRTVECNSVTRGPGCKALKYKEGPPSYITTLISHITMTYGTYNYIQPNL